MQIKAFVKNNAPVICTATAVTATTAAVVFSARGHLKARDIVASENLDRDEPLTRVEDIKLTWKYYAPAAASDIIAVASVVFLNKAYTSHISAIVSAAAVSERDRKSTRLNSSHVSISYAVFCLKKKNKENNLL